MNRETILKAWNGATVLAMLLAFVVPFTAFADQETIDADTTIVGVQSGDTETAAAGATFTFNVGIQIKQQGQAASPWPITVGYHSAGGASGWASHSPLTLSFGTGTGNTTPEYGVYKTYIVSGTVPLGTAPGSYTLNVKGTNQSGASNLSVGNPAHLVIDVPDTTAPTITITSPTATTYDLNQSVAASYSCADDVAATACAGPVANGANIETRSAGSHTFTVDAGDAAGNPASQSVTYTVNAPAPLVLADTNAPTVSCDSADGAWHGTNVSIACTASDPVVTGHETSGLANSADASFNLTTSVVAGNETSNASTNSHPVLDNAGNSTTAGPIDGNKVDLKAPSITGSRSPATGNSAGWNNSPVTVSFSCSDGGSGLAAGSPPADTVLGEGQGQSVDGTCTDNVGNSASATVNNINIDTTDPATPAASIVGTLGNNDYYTSNVTVSWADNGDNLSGVASCSSSTTINSDTNGQNVSGTCTDNAGNVSAATTVTVKRDATKPSLSPSVSPNPVVLNYGEATASPNARDATSDIASANCNSVGTSSVGGQSVPCAATDNAGNTNSASESYSVIYSTGACLGAPGHTVLQPVNADGSSIFKVGSTVPVKFRVCDANGVSIGSAGVATAPVMTAKVGAGSTGEFEAVVSTTPDTGFRWSATDQQWIFNLSTKNLVGGAKYSYTVNLNDGSHIDFAFNAKK